MEREKQTQGHRDRLRLKRAPAAWQALLRQCGARLRASLH